VIVPTDLLHPAPAPHFKTFQVFLICFPNNPNLSTINNCGSNTIFIAYYHIPTNALIIPFII
jgi:hypothetical protein